MSLPCILKCPVGRPCLPGDWGAVAKAFEVGAKEFKAKRKRLPALVIDGAEFLMESPDPNKPKDVQFVEVLVDLAKARTSLRACPSLACHFLCQQ